MVGIHMVPVQLLWVHSIAPLELLPPLEGLNLGRRPQTWFC